MNSNHRQSRSHTTADSLEQQVSSVLDASVAELPASVLSRLRSDRQASLEALEQRGNGWLSAFDWRPAMAAAALTLLAVVLLFAPAQPQPAIDDSLLSESWLAGDEYFLGDDMSLYLWLNETGDLEGGYEG